MRKIIALELVPLCFLLFFTNAYGGEVKSWQDIVPGKTTEKEFVEFGGYNCRVSMGGDTYHAIKTGKKIWTPNYYFFTYEGYTRKIQNDFPSAPIIKAPIHLVENMDHVGPAHIRLTVGFTDGLVDEYEYRFDMFGFEGLWEDFKSKYVELFSNVLGKFKRIVLEKNSLKYRFEDGFVVIIGDGEDGYFIRLFRNGV